MDNRQPLPQTDESAIRRRVIGFFLFPIALFPLLALATYDWHDMVQLCIPPRTPSGNLIGIAGDTFAYCAYSIMGLGAWSIPLLCVVAGVFMVWGKSLSPGRRTLGFTVFTISLTCLLQITSSIPAITSIMHELNIEPDAGGAIGYLIMTKGLSQLISPFGSGVLMVSLMLFSVLFTIGFRNILTALGRITAWAADREAAMSSEAREEARRQKEEQIAAAKAAKEEAKRLKEIEKAEMAAAKAQAKAEKEAAKQAAIEEKERARQALIAAREQEIAEQEAADAAARKRLEEIRAARNQVPPPLAIAEPAQPAPQPQAQPRPQAMQTQPAAVQPAAKVEEPVEDKGPYILPPVEKVLNPVPQMSADHGDVATMEQRIVDTLKVFNVDVMPAFRVTGPVVTQYALTPAPGVKAERISALSANLQMALEAKSLRILAPIPGKNAVGIEVPNPKPASVCFREIIDGELWRTKSVWPEKGQPKFHLPLLLGKDAAGNDLVVDLAKMPHMLVAGATGQGKSVCLNSIINGLLMCRTPDQLRFIMVDPKRVEFTSYNRLPHLLVPVINDSKKVSFSLRWAVVEMEKRLKMFSSVGCRNIVDFNTRKVVSQPDFFGGEETVSESDIPRTIPYIVIVIDEVADIMASEEGKKVEPIIARLTALARATGIHLILATQRPDTKVITGTIKSNIPGRIAFKTSSSIDSRTILDSPGSEDLIGRGDMLFRTAEGLLLRAQGSYISDEEIGRIVDFIGEHSTVQFDAKFTDRLNRIKEASPEDALNEGEDGEDTQGQQGNDADPLSTVVTANGIPPPAGMAASKEEQLYLDALDVLARTGRASTSHLQRRMGIGYNHAARLIDLLEDRGVIGPAKGAGSREILLDPESIRNMASGQSAPTPDAPAETDAFDNPETPETLLETELEGENT